MDTLQKKNNLFIPFIVAGIGSALMLLTIFLPYTSATKEFAERIDSYPEAVAYSNTDIKNISYYNKSNNYYIVKDDIYVYVFDLNYDKVYSKDISELSASKLDIVYRRSNIYYEDKVRDKDKLTYKYYDVSTLEEVFDIDVGGI